MAATLCTETLRLGCRALVYDAGQSFGLVRNDSLDIVDSSVVSNWRERS